ncbi:unnamed protein product [Schistosoma margrebowiei]|uniref:Uncharacterized protein n=1 Tax=Schistosoma margrebowiei TaxID=48269 RepID=A0A3P8HFW3_9TREM|nr:unnamed protein product [Schistosoma margrebowiei]
MYVVETWRTTKSINQSIQVFINSCLCKIFGSVGGRNQEEEALEVDRTHNEERTQLSHKVSPHMESSRSKDERKTKEWWPMFDWE